MKYSDQTTKHLNVKPAVSETSSPALNYFRLMILTLSLLLFIWKILRTIIYQPNTDIPVNSVRKLSPQKRINLFTLFLFSESEWKISVRGGDWSLQWWCTKLPPSACRQLLRQQYLPEQRHSSLPQIFHPAFSSVFSGRH